MSEFTKSNILMEQPIIATVSETRRPFSNHVAAPSSGDYKRSIIMNNANNSLLMKINSEPILNNNSVTSINLSSKSGNDKSFKRTKSHSILNFVTHLFSKQKTKHEIEQTGRVSRKTPNTSLDITNFRKTFGSAALTPMLSPISDIDENSDDMHIHQSMDRLNDAAKCPRRPMIRFSLSKQQPYHASSRSITTVNSHEDTETASKSSDKKLIMPLIDDTNYYSDEDDDDYDDYENNDDNEEDEDDDDDDLDNYDDDVNELEKIISDDNLMIDWNNVNLYALNNVRRNSYMTNMTVNSNATTITPGSRLKPIKPIINMNRAAILGKGSFGFVVHGTLITADGTTKDVAIKIATTASNSNNRPNPRYSTSSHTQNQDSKLDAKANKLFLKMKKRAIREASFMRLVQSKVKDKSVVSEVYGIIQGPLPPSFSNLLKKNSKEVAIGIVMEYEGGGTLEEFLTSTKNRIIPLKEKLRLLVEISRAMNELHAAGIIHADIKAANILLSSDRPGHCKPKIADFGMSRIYKLNDPSASFSPNSSALSMPKDSSLISKESLGVTSLSSSVGVLPPTSDVSIISNVHTSVANIHSSMNSNITAPKGKDSTIKRKMTLAYDFEITNDRLSMQKMTTVRYGTRAFCAPEMLINPYQPGLLTGSGTGKEATLKLNHVAQPSRRTDMYAFGLLAWQVLTQKRPFAEITSEAMLVSKVHKDYRPDLTKLPPETPKEVIEMIQLCWHGDREKRKTAYECVQILEKAYKFLPYVNPSDRNPRKVRDNHKDAANSITNNEIVNGTKFLKQINHSIGESNEKELKQHTEQINTENEWLAQFIKSNKKQENMIQNILEASRDSRNNSPSQSVTLKTSLIESHAETVIAFGTRGSVDKGNINVQKALNGSGGKYDKGLDMRAIYSDNRYADEISYSGVPDIVSHTTERTTVVTEKNSVNGHNNNYYNNNVPNVLRRSNQRVSSITTYTERITEILTADHAVNRLSFGSLPKQPRRSVILTEVTGGGGI